MKKLKQLLFERLLEHDVQIVVRPSLCKGIPGHPADLNTLDYGLNKPIPIEDFVVDETGIKAILSFNQKPQETFVPWEAMVVLYCEACMFHCAWGSDNMGIHIALYKNEHPITNSPSSPPDPSPTSPATKPKLSVVR